jgi:hypothetical protein
LVKKTEGILGVKSVNLSLLSRENKIFSLLLRTTNHFYIIF